MYVTAVTTSAARLTTVFSISLAYGTGASSMHRRITGASSSSKRFSPTKALTVAPTPHLDNKHVVFGTVVEGEDVVMAINDADTKEGRPQRQIRIVDAGELKE